MPRYFYPIALIGTAIAIAQPAAAQDVQVTIDASAARAVLAAVVDPALTEARALEIARLPGNRGLIRKASSYGRVADEGSFAAALLATARRRPLAGPTVDSSGFDFETVRKRAAATTVALDALEDPRNGHLAAVKQRIVAMSPKGLRTVLTGRIVAGGTSGGFTFGDPEFFLNIDRFPSAPLAARIMQHEMFHGIQGVVMKAATLSPATRTCLTASGGSALYGTVFAPLLMEGTASYVGDVLAAPEPRDAAALAERDRFQRNVNRVSRAVTLLDLSAHALTTTSGIKPDDVYELGFYGDEILYALGYVMARAMVAEQGPAAIPELLDQKVWTFIVRYTRLKAYGTTDAVPRLGPIAVRWAETMAACETA